MSLISRLATRRASAALTMLACVVLSAAACERNQREPIRIGVAGPFLSAVIVDNLHGAEMAIAEANARGGIDGRPLEVSLGEDRGNPELAVIVAEAFVKDPKVVAVVGHLSSATALITAPLYHGNLATVATMPSSPALTNVSPWFFRIAASDAVLGADLARFAVSKGWRRVAILYQNDAYGRALSSALEQWLDAAGGETISSDAISTSSIGHLGYGAFLRTYARRRPDVIVLITAPALGLTFLHEAAAARLNVPIIGSDGWSPERLASDAAAEGVYIPSSFLTDHRDSVANGFRARFRARHGHDPDMYAATGYDAALVIIAAIRRVGTDRARIREALASRAVAPVQGATGPIHFEAGDRIPRFGGLVRIESGAVRPYLRWKE